MRCISLEAASANGLLLISWKLGACYRLYGGPTLENYCATASQHLLLDQICAGMTASSLKSMSSTVPRVSEQMVGLARIF